MLNPHLSFDLQISYSNLFEILQITSNNKKLEQKETQTFLDVFKSGPLRLATVCLLVAYTGCNMVVDGLIRLSGSFGLDFFLTFSLNSGTEIPALILLVFILDRYAKYLNISYASFYEVWVDKYKKAKNLACKPPNI